MKYLILCCVLAIWSCGNHTNDSSVPAIRMQIQDSTGTDLRIALDSTLLTTGDSVVFRVLAHPDGLDSALFQQREGAWVIPAAPDGFWKIAVSLFDPQGRRLTGDTLVLERVRRLSWCGMASSQKEWRHFLNSTLLIAAGNEHAATTTRSLMARLIASLLTNPVNFSKLEDLHLTFQDGTYTYGTDTSLALTRFTVIANEKFGNYLAGDTLRDDLTAIASYAHGFSLRGTDYSWTPGPLYGLLGASLSFNGLKPNITLDASRLRIQFQHNLLDLRDRYTWSWDSATQNLNLQQFPADSLNLHFSYPDFSLAEMKASLDSGLYYNLDHSHYRSEADQLQEQFGATSLRLYTDTAGNGQFAGDYHIAANRAAFAFYMHGVVSSNSPEYTVFTCDAERQDTVGIAHHSADLLSGVFVTPQGDSVHYGLTEY